MDSKAARGRRTCGGKADYRALKRSLFADLRGTVLEIGAGAGANFGLLPADVRWLGLEPSRRRRRRLIRSAVRGGAVLAGVGEQIPLRDQSVDAVISTIVLCSVRDQEQVLAEVRRVLRRGGTFVFCEHVAAQQGSRTRRMQRALAPLTRRFDDGCDPGRETWHAIEQAGFTQMDMDWFTIPPRWSVYNPCIAGRAIALAWPLKAPGTACSFNQGDRHAAAHPGRRGLSGRGIRHQPGLRSRDGLRGPAVPAAPAQHAAGHRAAGGPR